MIGIIAAMQIEIDGINERISQKSEKIIAGITFSKGYIGDKEVVTAVSGMGKVNAAMCAEIMILEFKPEVIINTGVAGAISKDLEITDIVISSSLYEYDLDITPLGYPLGYISGADIVEIPSDRKLSQDLVNCSHKVLKNPAKTGVIVSGDKFVNDNELKEFLREKFHASACEMEGAAIGHVCYMNKVPFSVVRAISDNAQGSADMDFESFSKIAADNSIKLMLEYLSM